MRFLASIFRFWLILAIGTSCGGPILGDPGHGVQVFNSSDTPVLVYIVVRTERVLDGRVEPGATRKTTWPYPPATAGRLTVEAYDQIGNQVFCKRYSLEDFERTAWKVEIVRAHFSCN